jgi:tripartite-type tricarboxylate transporter receptor subunit TctC
MILGSVGTPRRTRPYKTPLYKVRDFTAVAFLAETPIAIITRPDLPVNNLKEFIAYAKATRKNAIWLGRRRLRRRICLRRAQQRNGHQDRARPTKALAPGCRT